MSTLESALNTNQLPHAFLFCGPRGVGKTTCARILARTLNCQNVQNGTDPCGECESCLAFERNASFNIFELDAASYNGVEYIRQLNDQVRVPPSEGKYKVYIIDEVHMLSNQAFNAFLKTLEEPPPYAVFILATTEKHKILPTILSRCQIFDFRRIQVKDIAAHLEYISQQEGITSEHDAMVTIAEKADGALRDALSLFDRMASVSNKSITYKTVVENLNLLDYDVFFKTADACLREDIRQVLNLFDTVIKNGFEGDLFLDGLAGHYRDLLVSRSPETLHLQEHSESLKERYLNQSQLMSTPYIFSALNLINEADIEYPMVRNKRLHVEMTLARICFLNRLTTGSPFVPEKKTADLSAAHVTVSSPPESVESGTGTPESVAENESSQVDIPSSDAPSAESQADPDPEKTVPTARPEAEDLKESVAKKASVVAPAEPGQKQSKGGTFRRSIPTIPQVKTITELQTEIRQQEEDARANSLELTNENLNKWWAEYQTSVSSPSTASALKHTQISAVDKLITIDVTSGVTKTRIQEMNSLLSDLRQAFHDKELQLEVNLNLPDDFEEQNKPKKILTNKEKYDILTSKNPNVEQLRQSLDLIVDHDD